MGDTTSNDMIINSFVNVDDPTCSTYWPMSRCRACKNEIKEIPGLFDLCFNTYCYNHKVFYVNLNDVIKMYFYVFTFSTIEKQRFCFLFKACLIQINFKICYCPHNDISLLCYLC